MSDSEPDFPIGQYTYDELCEISYHIQGARWHVEQALDTLAESDRSIGRAKIAEAYAALTYVETAIAGCVKLKQREVRQGNVQEGTEAEQ